MLSPIDHWIREKFIYKTHIYTMRLPEFVPRGIRVIKLDPSPSSRYHYRLISPNNKKTDRLVQELTEKGLMYSTQVVESKGPLKKLIAPKNKSVLLSVFWLSSMVGFLVALFNLANKLRSNEVFMANLRETIDLFLSK